MTSMTWKRAVPGLIGAAALTFGIVAPAVAEGTRTGHMNDWGHGHSSSSWSDENTDSTNTHVTVYYNCHAFPRVRIRKENLGPDTTVGEEEIDCAAYDDAVYAGDVPADNYHFDVRLPQARTITGDYKMFW